MFKWKSGQLVIVWKMPSNLSDIFSIVTQLKQWLPTSNFAWLNTTRNESVLWNMQNKSGVQMKPHFVNNQKNMLKDEQLKLLFRFWISCPVVTWQKLFQMIFLNTKGAFRSNNTWGCLGCPSPEQQNWQLLWCQRKEKQATPTGSVWQAMKFTGVASKTWIKIPQTMLCHSDDAVSFVSMKLRKTETHHCNLHHHWQWDLWSIGKKLNCKSLADNQNDLEARNFWFCWNKKFVLWKHGCLVAMDLTSQQKDENTMTHHRKSAKPLKLVQRRISINLRCQACLKQKFAESSVKEFVFESKTKKACLSEHEHVFIFCFVLPGLTTRCNFLF